MSASATPPRRILEPGNRAVVLYDDECNLCKTISVALLDWDRARGTLLAAPIQSAAGERLLGDLPDHVRLSSFHYVGTDGVRHSGGQALAPLFAQLPGGHPIARLLRALPRPVGASYEFVATNRVQLSRFVPGRLKVRARSRLERVRAERSDELAALLRRAREPAAAAR